MANVRPSLSADVKDASIFQWNVRGLLPRISDLRQFVFTKSIPILVICGPRLSGYDLFQSATPSKVAVFIRRALAYAHHPVQPHRGNVCLTTRKRRLTFTLVGAF